MVPLTSDAVVLACGSAGDSPLVTESVEDTLFEVWLAKCKFSPGMAVVDTGMACVQVLMPPKCNPVPTGSAVLKKRNSSLGLVLMGLADL